jgi:hypothetical protein
MRNILFSLEASWYRCCIILYWRLVLEKVTYFIGATNTIITLLEYHEIWEKKKNLKFVFKENESTFIWLLDGKSRAIWIISFLPLLDYNI